MFVITGGSRGIGEALAKNIANQDHMVLIIGRDQKTLDAVAKNTPNIQTCVADVSKIEGRENILKKLEKYDQIKGLIHNAGAIEPIAPMKTLTPDAWQNIMDINLCAPFFLTQALYPRLINGRILHIGSGAAYFPIQGWAPYCVSKAGLAMLTRSWQLECPEVATASVMPGIVATEMQAHIRASENMHPDKNQFFQTLNENNQLITPDTVAHFLTWLLLTIDKTRYVSQEWDIYETQHHVEWLKAPHQVPALE
ncbi:MAG: SDR family NAD(P)-dependent oxidoreductase [Gammaproteobacteria bacterium]|nr:SDR family NAD(P)-dependent oxidoreductase [Gammaproteobacteria bacterium]